MYVCQEEVGLLVQILGLDTMQRKIGLCVVCLSVSLSASLSVIYFPFSSRQRRRRRRRRNEEEDDDDDEGVEEEEDDDDNDDDDKEEE